MTTFSVLIVGGGVAGLVLANILEKYNIEYTLLEKHNAIVSDLGASVAILPHGSRVLDQIGCYHNLRSRGGPVKNMGIFGPDGKPINSKKLPEDCLKTMLGYRMWYLDRQQLIEGLFDNLVNKTRIYTSCDTIRVDHTDQGVIAEVRDGRVFTGSIVVGADGVHSWVRQEMWRMVERETSRFKAIDQQNAIQCTYSCIFGVSKGLDSLGVASGGKAYHHGRSYMCHKTDDDMAYWFAFFKNPKQTRGHNIPRYTASDQERFAAQLGPDTLMPNLTFKDLYERRVRAVLVPLEEFVLDTCYHGRVILLGDSAYKFHPLIGQGCSSAIESAAYFADRLRELTLHGSIPSYYTLQTTFAEFQKVRRPRAESFLQSTNLLVRLESLDNVFLEYLSLHVLSKLPEEVVLSFLAEACTPGASSKYLPAPSRCGVLPFEDEIQVCPRTRSLKSTVLWTLVFVCISIARLIFSRNAQLAHYEISDMAHRAVGQRKSTRLFQSSLQVYFAVSVVAMNGLWCLESYRNQLTLRPISSTIPFIILSFFAGWDIATSLYFALYVLLSHRGGFYYPSPRAIPLPVARALPIALVLTYSPTVGYGILGIFDNKTWLIDVAIFKLNPWSLAHAGFPAMVFFTTGIISKSMALPRGPGSIWTDADIPYISRFQYWILLISSTAHVLFLTGLVQPISHTGHIPVVFDANEPAILLGTFSIAIVLWLFFTVSELRRLCATDISWRRTTFYVLLGAVILGPSSCLAAGWYWRETTLEKARTRKETRKKLVV